MATLEDQPPDLAEMRRRTEGCLATHAWLVAEVDGAVVAYAYGGPHPTLGQRGYRLALAGVTLPHDAGAGLHESLGFRQVATFPGVGWKHDAWHDTGWWASELSPPRPA